MVPDEIMEKNNIIVFNIHKTIDIGCKIVILLVDQSRNPDFLRTVLFMEKEYFSNEPKLRYQRMYHLVP